MSDKAKNNTILNTMIDAGLIILGWFLLGWIAKGIIRGNNIGALRESEMNNRKGRLSVYWILKWERDAFLLGPIGLYQVIRVSCQKGRTFTFWKFSVRPHGLKVRLGFVPVHYNGRLVSTQT